MQSGVNIFSGLVFSLAILLPAVGAAKDRVLIKDPTRLLYSSSQYRGKQIVCFEKRPNNFAPGIIKHVKRGLLWVSVTRLNFFKGLSSANRTKARRARRLLNNMRKSCRDAALPVALEQHVIVAKNTAKPIILAGSARHQVLTYTIQDQPVHGVLSGNPPELLYTPQTDYLGPDSFTFSAASAKLASAPATVTIEVAEFSAHKQTIVNAITKAAHAYWEQRVVIEHPQGPFYGYSGEVTVLRPENPADRYYNSDDGFIPEAHIFHEEEDSKGHAAAAYGFLRAYQASGDKFLLGVVKSLGETLLSAQAENGSGGWFYDMGVIGYDRQPGSPTYKQTRDYDRWVNFFPWGGHGNVADNEQNLGSFDGVSWIPALYLLRLYQALPVNDAERERYLNGAKILADTILGFKDVVDDEHGFKPYGSGGIPQIFPYNLMKHRDTINGASGYPFDLPYNVMVTLNDHALVNALFFMIEFWKEAKTNPALNEQAYLEGIRLNIDYLISVFRLSANPSTGHGAWASQYWINDGSPRALRPTWGRRMEPPGIGFFGERADEVLLDWWQYETNASRRQQIEDVLTKFFLYFKYDAPPVNSRPEWRQTLQSYMSVPSYVLDYDPNDIDTWYWWLWYNHDPAVAPLNVFVASGLTEYAAHYGEDALLPGHFPESNYPMVRNNGLSAKIGLCLVENGSPHVDLLHGTDDRHDQSLEHYFNLEPNLRLFGGWEDSAGRVSQALEDLDPASGFFLPQSATLHGSQYTILSDDTFSSRLRWLAWGLENEAGALYDSDGDGKSDSEELAAGGDPFDSAD